MRALSLYHGGTSRGIDVLRLNQEIRSSAWNSAAAVLWRIKRAHQCTNLKQLVGHLPKAAINRPLEVFNQVTIVLYYWSILAYLIWYRDFPTAWIIFRLAQSPCLFFTFFFYVAITNEYRRLSTSSRRYNSEAVHQSAAPALATKTRMVQHTVTCWMDMWGTFGTL